jgi:hypothetical protein
VLFIQLAHLSESGHWYINDDLHQRVTKLHIDRVHLAQRHTFLDVGTIFAWKVKQKDVSKSKRYNVRVLIQSYMNLKVGFMICKFQIL